MERSVMNKCINILVFFIVTALLTLLLVCNAEAGGAFIWGDSGGAVACTWKTAWSATTVASQPTWDDYNEAERNRRTIISSGDIAYSGDQIRLVFQGHSSQADSIMGMSIGLRSGSTEDYASAPTRVTCSSGNSCLLAAGTTTTSDNISFTLSSSNDYLVHVYTGDPGNNYEAYLTMSGAAYSEATATDRTMTEDVTMSSYGYISHLSNIEVCTTE
jgi:hypothetical protein